MSIDYCKFVIWNSIAEEGFNSDGLLKIDFTDLASHEEIVAATEELGLGFIPATRGAGCYWIFQQKVKK